MGRLNFQYSICHRTGSIFNRRSRQLKASGQMREVGHALAQFLICEVIVAEVAVDELVIRRHVDQSVTAEIEEDNLLFARLLALQSLADGSGDGVATLRSRHSTVLPTAARR